MRRDSDFMRARRSARSAGPAREEPKITLARWEFCSEAVLEGSSSFEEEVGGWSEGRRIAGLGPDLGVGGIVVDDEEEESGDSWAEETAEEEWGEESTDLVPVLRGLRVRFNGFFSSAMGASTGFSSSTAAALGEGFGFSSLGGAGAGLVEGFSSAVGACFSVGFSFSAGGFSVGAGAGSGMDLGLDWEVTGGSSGLTLGKGPEGVRRTDS